MIHQLENVLSVIIRIDSGCHDKYNKYLTVSSFPGMNLQICFMNETASDCESQCSDTESTQDREVDHDHTSTTSSNSKVVFLLKVKQLPTLHMKQSLSKGS